MKTITGRVGWLIARGHRRLFGHPSFYRFHRYLYQLSSRGIGLRNCNVVCSGEHRVLKNLAATKRNPVIVDVGAHDGEYSALAKKLAPQASVYALEPHPNTFERLKKRGEEYQFHSFPLALGGRTGEAQLFDHAAMKGTVWSSTDEEAFDTLYEHPDNIGVWRVPMTTLDEFAEAQRIPSIDLLKIDVEGLEWDVLCGAQKLIAAGAIQRIQFEVSLMQLIRKISFADFQTLLKDYRLYRVLPGGLLPFEKIKNEDVELKFFAQNWLAVKNDSAN